MPRSLLFLPLIVLIVLAGCSKQEAAGEVIRVAVTPASPPNLYEENGRTVGLDLEIFEGYCAARGCTMRITAYDWQGMLGAIVSGKADVAFSAISITDARQQVMDFSEPYMDNTWNMVSMMERDLHIENVSELKQYSIGCVRGQVFHDYIRDTLHPEGIYPIDQVRLYPTSNELFADLKNGNLDIAFVDGTVASAYRKTLPLRDSYVFSGLDRYGFAFPKGSELREDFNRYLAEDLGPEGLQSIIDRWMH